MTLLVADSFLIENDLLYRLTTPRNKRERRLRPLVKRLCIPLMFRYDLINHVHCYFGHFGVARNFLTLSQRFFWKGMYKDIVEFSRRCDVCLRAKRNYQKQIPKLHPLAIPTGPGQVWSADFKQLVRPTKQGHTAILCLIDNFTSWPILVPTKTQTAEEAAQVFMREVIAIYGLPSVLMTDKGPGFTAKFFKYLTQMLGFQHRTSASRNARSNGIAEGLIQRINALLKIYNTADDDIERVLPLVAMALRASNHTRFHISPHELQFGRIMNLGGVGAGTPNTAIPRTAGCIFGLAAKVISNVA